MSQAYNPSPTDIAIVGMSARVPGARNVQEFWENLRDGKESIRRLSKEALLAAGVDPADLAKPNYVRVAAILDDLRAFDAGFFGFSRKDAAIMDPQHRHFLECCWEALEHSGHVPQSFPGSIGVFGGCGMNAYFMFNLINNKELMDSTGIFLVRHTGNDKDFLCTRASYQFNLKGPSISVQTACSTSLVAIHTASQSLINGECDMALAGGVTIEIPHGRGYLFEEGEILSHDGHCRSFDAASTGTVFGSGAGVVVLRRVQDAIDDGDNILAIIRATAINNDGSGKVGYLAPGLEGQAAVYAEAISLSGVEAGSIRYIEAHGTGTQVGDPIEVAALTQAFRQFTERNGFCALGSVKSNIGHLDTAAGVVGLIKTVQALRHRQIPPTLHFEKPNPLIAFEETPFFVSSKLQPWAEGDEPRRAGVSSLGVGGTNAHVILEEAPPQAPIPATGTPQILLLSAKSQPSLEAASDRLASALLNTPHRLEDIAFTLQRGRAHFPQRRALVSRSASSAALALTSRDTGFLVSGDATQKPPIGFLFAGGGAQYADMGKGLYRDYPLYREILDQGLALFKKLTGENLEPWLFRGPDNLAEARKQLERPYIGLPALFLTQYATGRLCLSFGVKPDALAGHSAGLYAAACLAGVMTLEEGLSIIVERGRLFETLPAGAMLSIALPEADLRLLLPPSVSIAAINSPELSVASGPVDAIALLEQTLRHKDIHCDRVHINVAAHSSMLESILEPFRIAVSRIQLKAPQIPIVSCYLGAKLDSQQACDPNFWTNELRHTVRFSDAAAVLLDQGIRVFIEVGPGQTLSSFVREQKNFSPGHATISSLRSFKTQVDDTHWFLTSLARSWTLGVDLDLAAIQTQPTRRVELPTYAWNHEDFWFDASAPSLIQPASQTKAPDRLQRSEFSDWFYQPVWRQGAESSPAQLTGSGPWLIFGDQSELQTGLGEILTKSGERTILVSPGESFVQKDATNFELPPDSRRDFGLLFEALTASQSLPKRIVFFWSKRSDGYASLLSLFQSIAEAIPPELIHVTVITENLCSVNGDKVLNPQQALALGAARVAPNEIPELSSLVLDVGPFDPRQARAALNEILANRDQVGLCALRDGRRWEKSFESLALNPSPGFVLRQGGVYLITGGQGGIGLILARHLAQLSRNAKIVLLGRHNISQNDPRQRTISEIEELGAEVLLLEADVADLDQMSSALAQANKQFGSIHGVLHAAGVIDDSPLSLKTIESVSAVLRPKVEGAKVLAGLLDPASMDFFILFSSTSSMLGLAGQFDYAASNAFLDAFALTIPGLRVIDWSMWQNVGMTSRSDTFAASVPLDTATQWVVSDHRTKSGVAFLPGSAYAAYACKAALRNGSSDSVRISNLLFLSPLRVLDGETVTAQIELQNERFTLQTQSPGGLIQHASAEVSLLPKSQLQRIDLHAIAERCRSHREVSPQRPYTHQGDFVRFGKRWDVVRHASLGDGEALLDLELHEDLHSDCTANPLHPALFDWATSGGLPVAPAYSRLHRLHVPMAVNEIVFHRPLPPRIFSHIRLVSGGTDNYETVTFDITIADPDGIELVTVEGFTLRRIDNSDEFVPLVAQSAMNPVKALDAMSQAALLPSEGAAALTAVLASPSHRRVIVSPLPFTSLLNAFGQERTKPVQTSTSTEGLPTDEVERWLVETCRELLGVPNVRPEDDFFALGGQSLVAVRLFLRVKRKFQLDLGMSTLFEARPLSKLAALIRGTLAREEESIAGLSKPWSSVVPIQSGTAKAQTLYLIHGVGGNVVGFEPLVRSLGPSFTVRGIQSVGIDGKLAPLTRVEDMATRYISDIRLVQPQGPYHLIGYSFGGMIAFEMAKQLRAQGDNVGLVAMMDTWQHAWLPLHQRLWIKLLLFQQIIIQKHPWMPWYRRRSLPARVLSHAIHLLNGPNRLCYLKSIFRAAKPNGPNAVEATAANPPVLQQHVSQTLNGRAAFSYVPKPYDGKITLFRATERNAGDPYPYHLGWKGLAAAGLEIHEVSGNHLNMGEEPNVQSLATLLKEILSKLD